MAEQMIKPDNPSVKWYFNDWLRDTLDLPFDERGLWMHMIVKTYLSPVVGTWTGPINDIGSVDLVWPILMRLAPKNKGNIFVNIDDKYVPMTMEHKKEWRELKVDTFTELKIVCRKAIKMEKAWKANEKKTKQAKIRQSRNNPGIIPDESRNNPGIIPDESTPTRAGVLLPSIPSNSPVVPPLSGGTARRRGKDTARVQENTPLMSRIGGWFKRQPETLWAKSEADKLADINPQEDEVELLERYYLSDDPAIKRFHRHDLVTMLNNWNRELDWAREKLGGGRADDEVVGAGAERMRGMEVV